MQVSPQVRGELRRAISTAYYTARNEGRTMESAADDAVERVVDVLAPVPPSQQKKEQS